jgi:hypothetical protein
VRRNQIVAVAAAVVVIAGAFLIGYLPQRRARLAAERQVEALQSQLTAAETRLRLGQLLGRVLTLEEVTMRQNYGQALDLSSSFFNTIRESARDAATSEFSGILNDILSRRDEITVALTKADAMVLQTLHAIELRLRGALGYSLPSESSPG